MQVDVARHLRGVIRLEALAPVVAQAVRVDAAIRVEASTGDGCRLSAVAALGHGLEALLAVLVPEVVGAAGVAATRSNNRRRRCGDAKNASIRLAIDAARFSVWFGINPETSSVLF